MDRSDSLSFPPLISSLPNFEGHFNAFELKGNKYKVLFAHYESDKEIPPHTHNTENVGIVIKGELILEKDGVPARYAAGSWYHLDPFQVHAARFSCHTEIIEFWFETPML